VDFSGSSGLASDGILTAGSIEGAGHYFLGGNKLYVGSNNRSTTVSGAVDDGGPGIGSGAVVHKVGTGTLTLSHANNTYANGTVLTQGTLDIAAKGAAGLGSIYFDAGKQTLKIENKALSAHAFGNDISFVGAGDVIDLAGLKFVKHAKATYDSISGHLTVHSGKVTDTLTLINPDFFTFKVVDDRHGGTKIIERAPGAKADALAATQHDSSQLSDGQHIARSMVADSVADSFQFKHQAEPSRHGATSFDPHFELGTETLAFNEPVANMHGMDHESYLANFHIDMHQAANLADHNFME
jgi:autotransporter-associated beta strand protein